MPSKINIVSTVAAIALAALFSGTPAFAASVDLTNPAFAQTAGPTSIPIGHSEFCKIHRSECGAFKRVVEVEELTESNWRKLVAVNDRMNREIVPVSDLDLYQVDEYWTYPQGYGDCEDITLAKRRELIAEGFDPSTLLISVVRQPNGEGHAVLMVRTDRGDLVLDNQDGMVRLWTETPYQFLKRQSQANAGQWVDIIDNRVVTVAQR
ncbi:MAG: transglutaminase-like cysteine peptidase [Alphaproteobacteria bacterium]|nr:transglutaminase-like cysteine peptidase [Alphaproteobacteria bacterium]